MASNKLTFDFGQPPNFDGLAEQKLIAHSVNVESLPDGSGVRTRSGMRHYYPFRVYSEPNSQITQIMSGLRTPDVENVNGNEVGIDLIYSVDENGKYIIKDMRQTRYIQTEDQYLTFTHVDDMFDAPPMVMIYSDGLYNNYYIMINRLSGSKKVVVNYIIGLISSEGQVVSSSLPVFAYTDYPVLPGSSNAKIIKGTLNLTDVVGEPIRSVDTHSIVGSATLNPNETSVKIPIDWPELEITNIEPTPYDHYGLAIQVSFDVYENNTLNKTITVKTTDLKIYTVSETNTVESPKFIEDLNGQSQFISLQYVYPNSFVGIIG